MSNPLELTFAGSAHFCCHTQSGSIGYQLAVIGKWVCDEPPDKTMLTLVTISVCVCMLMRLHRLHRLNQCVGHLSGVPRDDAEEKTRNER